MRAFLSSLRLADIFFRLPLFLAAVCIAPNFNEARLLGVLVVTHFLVYPASAFTRHVIGENRGKWYLASLLTALLVSALAYRTGLWFSVGVLTYLLFILSEKLLKNPSAVLLQRALADGWLILAVAFCGLNDYDPSHIWQVKVTIMGLLSSLWVWFIYRLEQQDAGLRRMVIWLFLTLIAGVVGTLIFGSDIGRIRPFASAMALPAVVLLIWNIRKETHSRFYPLLFKLLTTVGLIAFLMWYFLDVTNVLQVFG